MSGSNDAGQAKESRFDPSRVPASPNAKNLIAEVRSQLLRYEEVFHPRAKKRRARDQERFDRIVTALVCELAHAALADASAWRYISMSKRMSPEEATGAAFMTAERIRIIEWMVSPEMDWLELRKGQRQPFQSTQTAIRASKRLQAYMDQHDIQFADLGRDLDLLGDPVVLRGPKVKGKAKTLAVPPGEPAETFRAEMHRINSWLATAEITCEYDGEGNPRDEGDRHLRRIFNGGRLDLGGRLYGGFWLQMSAADRLGDITINGERVAALDFGQCGVRIAYGLAGAIPPSGDLYLIPGLERFREGVKKLLNSMLAWHEKMPRFPAGTRHLFPSHLTVHKVQEQIREHHHPIVDQFYSAQVLTHQFVDSQVIVRSLLRLAEQGLVALPVHDALLVPHSTAAQVAGIMLDCFREITGVEGVVSAATIDGELPIPTRPQEAGRSLHMEGGSC
jgi:hypothetical protein